VTAVVLPGGIQWNAFNRTLTRETGVTIAGGQGDFAGKIFRVAHLGYHDDLDMVAVVAALERALALHGHPFDTGAGVSATQKALHPSERSS
jgi:aspartate aminotransferase-like enzyme